MVACGVRNCTLQTSPLLCQLCIVIDLAWYASGVGLFSLQTSPGCLSMEYAVGSASGCQLCEPHVWFLIIPVCQRYLSYFAYPKIKVRLLLHAV